MVLITTCIVITICAIIIAYQRDNLKESNNELREQVSSLSYKSKMISMMLMQSQATIKEHKKIEDTLIKIYPM